MGKAGTRLQARAGAAAGAAARPRLRLVLAQWASSRAAALREAVAEEAGQGRLILWLPVAAIAGIALFFAADTDPSLIAAMLMLAGTVALAVVARRRPLALPLLVGTVGLVAGFFAATLRSELVAAPILSRAVYGEAVGTVVTVEARSWGDQLLLQTQGLTGVSPSHLPRYLRVTVRGHRKLQAGDRVAIDTVWLPPPGPALPGGYDFARTAWFQGLGGVGRSTSKLRMLPPAPLRPIAAFEAAVDRLRNAITARILAVVPGPRGAVGASMVAGERGGIPESMNVDMRIAGIYHVISISGLHMALVAGGVFWALRLILVLVPGIALRWPVKKWAALAALAAAAAYLVLSGNEVATQRSFIMIALVLIAVATDRAALTLRNVAVSALLVLALTPEAAIGPSFQMSFSAVVALVAWYERRRTRPPAPATTAPGRALRWLVRHIGGAAVVTLLAGFATAPSAAFHFQRLSAYALAANIAALPLISFVIMPAVVIGMVLMPFGLDAPAWWAMGYGVDGMIGIAHMVASWPGASRHVVAFGPTAFLLMSLGLLWTALFATRLRWLGLVPALAGLWLAAAARPPDVYIGPEGQAVAVRGPDGRLRVIGVRFATFATDEWLAADGDERTHRDRSLADGVFCDPYGCTAPLKDGRRLALDWSYTALRTDCARAAIVVTALAVPAGCSPTVALIDGAVLTRGGAVTLTLDGVREETARSPAGTRRWYNRPAPPIPPPPLVAPAQPEPPPEVEDEEGKPALSASELDLPG